MAKGKKLDLFIGTDFGDEWHEVQEHTSTPEQELLKPEEHRLVFKKEKRRGKVVTVVGPFHLEPKEATVILKALKKRLGCGGALKGEWMEFQGDLSVKLRPLLSDRRFCLR